MIWVIIGAVITGFVLIGLMLAIVAKMRPSKRGAGNGSYHDIGYPGESDGGSGHPGGH